MPRKPGGEGVRYEREDACLAWLSYAHAAPHHLTEMIRESGGAQAVYERFTRGDWESLRPWLTEKQMRQLQRQSDPRAMHDMLVTMRDNGIGVLSRSAHLPAESPDH